jgi:hypothetical protein
MKKFIEVALVFAVLLLTASTGLSQSPTFQTGDVFAGVGGGQIQWYRNGILVTTLQVPGNPPPTFDTGMAFDAAGNLYTTDFDKGSVSKFDRSGNFLSTFASGLTSPESMLFDSTGNAYVGQADGTHQVIKFDSSGNQLTTFSPAIESRGTDWIDLTSDQKTLFYTSEGKFIKRFDVSTLTQLNDFNSIALPGSHAFAVRILPNGNVLVADSSAALQLNSSGTIIHTYNPCVCSSLFSLNLDPDGVHFWVGDSTSGNIYRIRIADAGTVVDQTIPTKPGTLFGVVVFGQVTSANTANLLFTPSPTPETQIATIGDPTDPSAQSLALTLASVTNAINVSVEFFYEPTDLSTGRHDIGIADGECEPGATDLTDFDCRLLPFSYLPLLPDGGQLVPHIIPSHNNLGVWVRVIATRVLDGKPAVAGIDYASSVDWFYAWNANPSLIPFSELATTNAAVFTGPVNPEYQPGWNNQNPQMYDRPGANLDPAFVFNITTYSKNCAPTCVGTADPGVGGHTKTLNDIVAAAPPNPPSGTALGTVELQVPVPGISPFPYFKGLPMLVSFELENETTEASIANALTPPHSVSVATLDFLTEKNIPVQFPRGFPTTFTYNKFFKSYYIFLSPAPYTPGTKYTLQINSDLFPVPVTATFVVKRDF